MRNGKLSRRSVLKGSTAFAAPFLFSKLLKAAAPDPTAVSPALIEAARKEDTVAFYTAMEIPVAETLGKVFEAKYPGMVVQVKRSGAERVFQRIGKEEAIRLYEVDVICSSDASHFVNWKRDGLLAPYVPEDLARHFPPEQVDPDGTYASTFAVLSPIGYNTNLVKREDAPKSFADLLDPKWKGKIVKGRPDYSGAILTATFQIARDLGCASAPIFAPSVLHHRTRPTGGPSRPSAASCGRCSPPRGQHPRPRRRITRNMGFALMFGESQI